MSVSIPIENMEGRTKASRHARNCGFGTVAVFMTPSEFAEYKSDKQAPRTKAPSIADDPVEKPKSSTKRKRTPKLNASLHKYCELLANELNAGGYTVQKILSNAVSREWTEVAVKELIWRPLQLSMTGIESTAKASVEDYRDVYLNLDRHLAEKFGVSVAWPNKEDLNFREMAAQYENN